jgi:hypothetical protein
VNAPPPHDPQLGERIADVVEYGAKVAIGLGALWAFIAKVAKPFTAWRRAARDRGLAEMEAEFRRRFAVEIQAIQLLITTAGRIDLLFEDHDLLLDIALDNRERHDETNALLDFLGFTSDRRTSDERREQVSAMVMTLAERRRERRRKLEP